MAPPSFSDLGQDARDIFSEGYNYGFGEIEVKSKTKNGVKFITKGSLDKDSGALSGELNTTYKCKEHGLTLTETWTTDNLVLSELSIKNPLVKGLRLGFDASFAPQTGKKTGLLKAAYKCDNTNVNCDVDMNLSGPTINGDATFGYNGFLAGCQMAFDTSKGALATKNFAFGYEGDDFTLHAGVDNATEFSGSVYQKISKQLKTGVQLSWTAGSNVTNFGIGGRYKLGGGASVCGKINNSGQLGVGYSQKLRKGVCLTLSSLVEAKNLNAGGHKFGLGLNFDL